MCFVSVHILDLVQKKRRIIVRVVRRSKKGPREAFVARQPSSVPEPIRRRGVWLSCRNVHRDLTTAQLDVEIWPVETCGGAPQ